MISQKNACPYGSVLHNSMGDGPHLGLVCDDDLSSNWPYKY